MLVKRMLTFLGLETEHIDWSAFRVRERILPGVDKALPRALARDLQGLLQDRTRELEAFLREEFDLCVGDAWRNTLGSGAAAPADASADGGSEPQANSGSTGVVFARAFDDEYLADLLDAEVSSSDPQLLVEGYYRYNLVLHRGRFLALALSLGNVNVERLHAAVAGGQDCPGILLGDSLANLKERIAALVIEQLQEKQRGAEQMVGQLQEQIEELCARQRAFEAWLSKSDAFIHRLRSSLAFRAGRLLGRWFTRALAFLRDVLGTSRPQRAVRVMAGTRLDPVLPQKPP
jgi:hypothetical protein